MYCSSCKDVNHQGDNCKQKVEGILVVRKISCAIVKKVLVISLPYSRENDSIEGHLITRKDKKANFLCCLYFPLSIPSDLVKYANIHVVPFYQVLPRRDIY